MTTVKARKVFFFQLFLVYLLSTRIHFSRHSKHRLVAVANYSLVKVLLTPTKVSLRLSCPGRGLSSLPSPSRTRRNPPEQTLVNRQMQNRLDVVVSKPFLEKQQQWGLVSCPSGKITTSVGVFKTDCLSEVLAAYHLLWERNCFCIFSPSWAGLHILFFHPASQSQQWANILKV